MHKETIIFYSLAYVPIVSTDLWMSRKLIMPASVLMRLLMAETNCATTFGSRLVVVLMLLKRKRRDFVPPHL